MRRAVLIVLGSIAALGALMVIAVAIAIATVDTGRLIEPLRARVKAATGRELALNGKVSIKPSLVPTVTLDDVSLGNASWAKAPQLATVKEIEVQVALMPLLQRRVEVEQITLIEPRIALESDAKGRGNWEFGDGSPSGGAAPATIPAIPALVLNVLTIKDGTLTYLDSATGKTTTVAIDNFTVHARSGDAPIDAQFRGKVDDVPLAINGNFGPLDQLRTRQWPYPIAVKGDVEGKAVEVSTRLTSGNGTLKLDDLDAKIGASGVTGSITIVTRGGKSSYEIALHYPLLAVDDLAFSVPASAGPRPSTPAPRSRYVIPDQPLPLAALHDADAQGEVTVDQLRLRTGITLSAVKLKFQLHDGKLDAPDVQASGFGGTLRGRIAIDATNATAPAINTRFEARDLDLAAILAAEGASRDLTGGKTRAAVDIAMRGNSPHEWAGSANGTVLMVVGPARLSNAKFNVGSWLDQLGGAINPFRKTDPYTELTCAVVRLPLAGGIAQIDRSIAVETTKYAVSASGTLDFRNEQLDLQLRPQFRQGVTLPIAQVADLVRFRGPFDKPQVTIDAQRSAETALRIGAAIGTGGWSILGESLFNATAPQGAGPCAVAINQRAAQSASTANTSSASPANIPEDIGKAIGNLFKH